MGKKDEKELVLKFGLETKEKEDAKNIVKSAMSDIDKLEIERVDEGLALLSDSYAKLYDFKMMFEYVCDKKGYDTQVCCDIETGLVNLGSALAGLVQWKNELNKE